MAIAFVIIFTFPVFSQIKIDKVGLAIGFGSISATSNSTFSFLFKGCVDVKFGNDTKGLRLSGYYLRDAGILIPEDRRNRNYPIIQGFSADIFTGDYLAKRIFVEASAGLLFLNDRIFSNSDEWGTGVNASVGISYCFFDVEVKKSGFAIGIFLDYGATITNTRPQFNSISATASCFL